MCVTDGSKEVGWGPNGFVYIEASHLKLGLPPKNLYNYLVIEIFFKSSKQKISLLKNKNRKMFAEDMLHFVFILLLFVKPSSYIFFPVL